MILPAITRPADPDSRVPWQQRVHRAH
jgi:hypothetical protein